MHSKRAKIWFLLAFSLINNLLAFYAAPQQGQAIDFKVNKVNVNTEKGLALRKEFNIDTPFLKAKKTSEIGFGNPTESSSESDSEDYSDYSDYSDESRLSRSKRAAQDDKSTQDGNLVHIRRKRAPCFGGTRTTAAPVPAGDGDGAGDGGDDGAVVDEGRRRRNARKARKANGGTKSKRSGRRRRQTEIENFNNEFQTQNKGKDFGDHVDQAVKTIETLWESIMQMSKQFVQTVTNISKDTAASN